MSSLIVEQRLEALELKIMELEQALQETQNVLMQHYQDINNLRDENARLTRRLQAMNDAGGEAAADTHEPPPHY